MENKNNWELFLSDLQDMVEIVEDWRDDAIIIDGKSTFVAKEEAIVYLQKLQDRRIQDMEDTIKHMSERLDKIKFEGANSWKRQM